MTDYRPLPKQKLITIEGDVFRADRVEAIIVEDRTLRVRLLRDQQHYGMDYHKEDKEKARAAQLRAVADWKKALE
jgi:hypothetical protein